MEKEYGLITKKGSSTFARHSVFESESDSDEDAGRTGTKVNLSLGKTQQQQIKKAQKSALAEDPTIYQYDEIFEEVQSKQKAIKEATKSVDKGSKYIKQLLKTADRRKKDYERHIERQIQKEREADADMFKDKEAFVTTAYRKKLEEMKKADELEKREAYLESIGDVTKQRDLGGFYRHIYEQKLGPNKLKQSVDDTKEIEESSLHSESNPDENKSVETIHKNKQHKERIYRKRKIAEIDDDDNEDAGNKLQQTEHLPCNLDADSDFSIDSDSEEEAEKEENTTNKQSNVENTELLTVKIEKNVEEKAVEPAENTNQNAEIKIEIAPEKKGDVAKVKIDKWAKRTVGEAFDNALMRYYERKALRQSH